MAWVEQHGERFHVAFRIGDRRFKKTLKTADRRAADALAQRIDERLRLIEAGHIVLPDGADLVAYLISNGRLERTDSIEKIIGRTLGEIIPEYLTSTNQGSLESNSYGTLKIHLNHILKALGDTCRIESISFASLQGYIDTPSRSKGRRGKRHSATTISRKNDS